MDLQWTEPRNDGGAPIESYVIEKKTKFGGWEPAITVPAKQGCKASVPNLTEGEEYQFRIIAVNKGGNSEPSEPCDSVVCTARFEKPSIDGHDLGDQTIKANTRLTYTVPIRGAPRPKVTWEVNGRKVESSDRVDLQTYGKQTILDIPFARRSDTGKYTLTLQNDLGSASASGNVIVLDRPSPPMAPLKVFDVTKNSCKVQFNPPTDDGGSPILHYLVEKMDVSRGTWSSAAERSSTTIEVTGLVHLKEYFFRVKAVNIIGESDPLATDKSIVAKNAVGK